MTIITLKSRILSILSICLLVGTFTVSGQTVVTHETFPNQFNTNFPNANNSNGTFVGSSGTWTASCNSNALSAIAVLQAYYSPVTNAIKIVNWNTSGKGAAECHAASPTVNLSGWTCSPNLNLSFKLYSYTCSSSDPNSFFKVEFSSNNGSSWTSVFSMSSAQIFAAYGSNGLTTLSVPIAAAYRVSGFKYRFSGYKPANQGNNFYLFVDEAKINATSCSGSIGDRVWYDADADGIQDAAETQALSGISVQLKNTGGTVLATTTTDASGNYLFSGLAAGTYKVDFPLTISGGTLTSQNTGSNDDVDSDASLTTGETANITLATNQNITNVDAGYSPTNLSLGNRVWYDTNNDGLNGGTENGIKNVTVRLYKDNNNDNVADGASIATDITDVDGYYMFTNLTVGNYIVGVVIPAGYVSSSVNGGDPDNNTDLDDNGQVMSGNEVRGLAITLTGDGEPTGGGEENKTYDFGLLPDCGCTNSAANLLTNESFENGTTGWSWSAANGSLTTGTGYVACGAKNGFNNQSSGTSKVWQDVNVSAGSTVVFSAFAGTHAPGIACSPKLSLIFLNSANAVIGQTDVTVTRVVGDYHDQLEQYSISAVAPAGTVKARVQSSITCNTMKLDAFCLTATTPANLNLGNFVWQDINNNGTQDALEPGINGAIVKLYADANSDNVPDGAAVATTATNASGIYAFGSLTPGNYIVGVTLPAGYVGAATTATSASANNDNNTDNNGVTTVSGELRSNFITLSVGGEPTTDGDGSNGNLTLDFGLKGTGALGNFVWQDTNNNGVQDATEPGINGATVKLYADANSDNVPDGAALATTTTNASGIYAFGSLLNGNYIVGVTLPAGYAGAATTATSTSPNNDNNTDNNGVTTVSGELRSNFITLTAGTEPTTDGDGNNGNLTLDFGLRGTGSIGNYVWEDLNRDGLQDASEPVIAGVTVTLTYPNATTISTTTNSSGIYSFTNLPAGTYSITFTTPGVFLSTLANANANGSDAIDSDPVNGVVSGIVLTAGETNNTIDAGFYKTINISGHVWNDANGLSDFQINQTGAQPIPNSLYLFLVDMNTNLIVQIEAVNLDGTYNFADVEINHSYRIVLSTILAFPGDPVPISFMPQAWQRVGENVGAGPFSGSDGVSDGILYIDTETSNIIEANIGIRLRSGEVIVG